MNNEPVAWMDKYGNICLDIDKKMNQGKITARNNYDANDIPLYTHPAKTLTDEEILSEWSLTSYDPKTFIWSDDVDADLILQFAKAILRKAQEK